MINLHCYLQVVKTLLLVVAVLQPAVAGTRVVDCQTDHRSNPIGLDRFPVHLSWRMDADARHGASQSAYRVQSAATREAIISDKAVWDTGKVVSGESNYIRYVGPIPKTGERVWWRVKIWDEIGGESAWSEPVWFEAGLLDERAWQGAEWIGGSPVPGEVSGQGAERFSAIPTQGAVPPAIRVIAREELQDANWMPWPSAASHPGGDPLVFSFEFDVSGYPLEAIGYWAIRNGGGASVVAEANGKAAPSAAVGTDIVSRTDFAGCLREGANRVTIRITPSKGDHVPADIQVIFAMRIVFPQGKGMDVRSGEGWAVGSGAAKAISTAGPSYAAGPPLRLFHPPANPAIWLKREFDSGRRIASARLYWSGLGYNETFLNGQKVGDAVLDPGLTDYEDWALYQGADVTALLRPGKNVWSVHLGNGFYHFPSSWGPRQSYSYGQPGVRGLLVLRYEDGREETIRTGAGWFWRVSPYVENDVYIGEVYDERMEPKDEFQANVEKGWQPARVISPRSPKLRNQDFEPIRVVRKITPVKFWQVAPETWMFDLGENIAGWPRLRFKEPAGKVLRLRMSEGVGREGKFLQVPHSFWYYHAGALQRHRLVSAGEGLVEWTPKFSYQGFRYVEVSGLSTPPSAGTLMGMVANTDLRTVATFRSSNKLLDSIFDACLRSQYGNMHSIFEDCPTREKGMWGADGYVAAMLGLQALESDAFFRQQIRLWFTGPQPGGLPLDLGAGPRRIPFLDLNWASTPIGQAYQLWIYRGDLTPAREFYPNLKRFLRWTEANSPDLVPTKSYYGDHADPIGIPRRKTDKSLLATQGFHRIARQFAALAAALNEKEDAAWANDLADRIRKVILGRWYDAEGKFLINSTHQSLALDAEIIPANDREEAGKRLASIYLRNGYQFDGGFWGHRIYPMLSEAGETDVALKMLLNTGYPGIARSIARDGATTIWERYIENPVDQLHVSQNHPPFTYVGEWVLQYLGGIRPDSEHPGFQHFLLRPHIPDNLDWVEATTETAYGTIRSAWKKTADGEVEWNITIPPNSTATVSLPEARAESVKVEGLARTDFAARGFQLSAGTWRISASLVTDAGLRR